MPLVGYHLIGFDKGPISFDPIDHKMLQTDEHHDRTARFFARTPYRLNMIFHNAAWINWRSQARNFDETETAWFTFGRIGKSRYSSPAAREELFRLFLPDLEPDPTAINIVHTGNATALPKIPLSPHIMAHRIGHIHNLVTEHSPFYTLLDEWAETVMSQVYGYRADPIEARHHDRLYAWGPKPHIDSLWWNVLYKAITTTRAGRIRRVNGWEYTGEWMAQYLNLGHIGFPEILPERLDLNEILRHDNSIHVPPPVGELVAGMEYSTVEFTSKVQAMFDRVLLARRGEVFVT